MSTLEKFIKENPDFKFDQVQIKKVKELEDKHTLMARKRMSYLNMLARKQMFNTEEQEMFTLGYIDCGFEYENDILQTIFDKDELRLMEAALSSFIKNGGTDDLKAKLTEDKLRMLQSKLGK